MARAKKETGVKKKTAADTRLFKRRSVLWPAKLLIGRHEISCQIWNLSLGGARVRVDLPIQTGTELVLSIEGRGQLSATVVWCENEAMGLDFNVPSATIKRMFEDRLHILGLDEAGE
ncbi:MAG: PilZ domain-containing protein [Kordiimonas sp.]